MDGTAVRDYIHVTDLADAHVAAMQYLDAGGNSVAVNLGTGKGHSVRRVISAVELVSGKRVPFRDLPRREGHPAELVADPRPAARILNWRPRYSDLTAIVKTACDWYSSKLTAHPISATPRSTQTSPTASSTAPAHALSIRTAGH